MPEQMAFDLPVRPALGREAFLASPANAEALAAIDAWTAWPNRRHLLIGPAGSGKTHLVHVWAAQCDARIVSGADLREAGVPDLAAAPALALEDADRGTDETAFFHLLNLTQAEGCALLVTARTRPADWGLGLPDLASRVGSMPVARLEPPDDALLAAVLVKQFDDRQLSVSPAVIDYLVNRIDRSFATARRVVAALDAAALAGKRAVTTHLAGEVLDKSGSQDA